MLLAFDITWKRDLSREASSVWASHHGIPHTVVVWPWVTSSSQKDVDYGKRKASWSLTYLRVVSPILLVIAVLTIIINRWNFELTLSSPFIDSLGRRRAVSATACAYVWNAARQLLDNNVTSESIGPYRVGLQKREVAWVEEVDPTTRRLLDGWRRVLIFRHSVGSGRYGSVSGVPGWWTGTILSSARTKHRCKILKTRYALEEFQKFKTHLNLSLASMILLCIQ